MFCHEFGSKGDVVSGNDARNQNQVRQKLFRGGSVDIVEFVSGQSPCFLDIEFVNCNGMLRQ